MLARRHVIMRSKIWWWWRLSGGGRKFLGHWIRHCRSRMSSESSKQGHTKRINQTISTKSEFCSIFLSFVVHILLSSIRSGSIFRVTVNASKCWCRQTNLSCTRPFPNAAFIRYILWPCLSNWDDICDTKLRLKCPRIFFTDWGKKEKKRKQQQKCFKWYTSDVTSRIEPEVAVLLITGENFNISWPILRELGRVQSLGLKIGITRGNSSIPFNKK